MLETVISNQYSGVRYGGTSSERNYPPLDTRPSTLARFGCRIFVCLWRAATLFFPALSFCLEISAAAHGQVRPPSDPYSVRCPPPADPHKLYFECVGRPFDFFEATLTKDWGGLRADLDKIGITPVASYTSQIMGNPGG